MGKVKSIIKAARVIEELAYQEETVSLTELSGKLDMPPSTLHRLLSSLREVNFVKQDKEDRYAPGNRLKILSYALLQQDDLREISRPYLETLKDRTGETANLVVLSSDLKDVIYVEQVASDATVRGFSLIGSRAPSYATGVGKVLIAEHDWEEVKQALQEDDLEPLTEHTITDITELKEELDKITEQGYAADREECERGAACIAAPLYDSRGNIESAISISGPSNRILGGPFSDLVDDIRGVAEELSRDLGFQHEKTGQIS